MARRRIEIEVLVDPSLAQKGFRQTGASAKLFGKNIEQAGRGAVVASASFKGLGRSVAFASAAFVGTAGFVSAIKSTIDAAEESQRVLAQTQNAVKRSGQSWERWGNTIDAAAQKLSQMSGFDDERLLGTFSLLERRTKDVNEALKLNATAANVARGMNIELEAAAKLVIKASLGQAGALRRVGIDAAKNATATQLLAQLNQKFAGSAAAYANTAAGAEDRFRVALENFQEVLGAKALPTIAKYLNQGADWLNNTKNQKRVTDLLSEGVGLLKDTIAALTPFVKTATGAAEGFSDAVGGARNALKLLIATAAAWKAISLVAKFEAVSAAAGASGAAGSVGLLRTRLLALRSIGPIALGVTIGVAVKYAVDKTGLPKGPSGIDIAKKADSFLGWSSAVKGILGDVGLYNGGKRKPVKSGEIRPSPDTMTAAQTHRMPQTFGTSGGGSARGNPPMGMAALSRSQRNALALAQARTPAQELAALAEQRAILANQIRSVRGRLGRASGAQAKKLADQLRDLEAQDTQAFEQIASINEAAARDATAAAKKSKAAQEKKAKAIAKLNTFHMFKEGGRNGLTGLTIGNLRKANLASNRAAAARETAGQFRALGLTSTGDELAPTAKALTREANRIAAALKGTPLDTDKNRNTIARARKVLSGQLGALNRDVRMKIRDLLDALDPSKQSGTGKLFKGHGINLAKITAGLGLSGPEARAVQFRLAGAHLSTMGGAGAGFIGGGKPVVIHVHDKSGNPKQTAREVSKELKKQGARGTQQRRGPYAGKRI